jgi:hypothetical protein
MKRLIIRLLLAMLTFVFGVGIQRALNYRKAPDPLPQPTRTVDCVPTSVVQVVVSPSPTPTPTPAPTPYSVVDYNANNFFPDGAYMPIGNRSRELRGFDSFEIWSSESHGSLSATVYVQTREKDTYEGQYANFTLLTNRRVVFITSSPVLGDFEYRFDGEFVEANPIDWADTRHAVLRGMLTKTKWGRKVFEQLVSFRVEHVGC